MEDIHTIQSIKENEYEFNFKTRKCVKNAITRPWRNFGVPPNATFYGESYIGK